MRGTSTAPTLLRAACSLLPLLVQAALSQTPPDAVPDHPYVLHLYTNLMQIPALVLDNHDRPARNVDIKHFAVSLDSGPKFRPAYVRLEGDDAISLSILLDLSGDSAELLPALREAIPALVPDVLHPKDHVSLYALDCSLVRTADDIPANGPALASAINTAETRLHPPGGSPTHKPTHCEGTVRLWDSLALISKNLSTLPGRRMVLVVTRGKDADSNISWSNLHLSAASSSIAIFALDFTDAAPYITGQTEDDLHRLCELTGGLALNIPSKRDVRKTLPRFFELMRSRYILEFRRPKEATSGMHNVNVTLDKRSDRIHTGGATVAVAKPEELADPNETLEPTTTPKPAQPHLP